MSHKIKSWLTSIRRSHSSSSIDDRPQSQLDNTNTNNPFENVASDVIQYILSFLQPNSLHHIRLIGKEWNNLCDIEQKTLALSINTPTEVLKYWMLKLRNIKHVNLSRNTHINNQFLIWLKKEYFPLKIRQKQRCSSTSSHSSSDTSMDCMDTRDIQLNIHIDISFCFGIDCVEEPQLYGRGGVNGHNSYLMKLMQAYTRYNCTFNIFGNFRIINPSMTLHPRHVVLLQLEALRCDEVVHCFKFASPTNRQFTGPLPRFERMIKIGYPAFIHWDHCRVSEGEQELAVNEREEIEFVTKKHFFVDIENKNQRVKFKWTLSKQTIEPYAQCWMTDSVSSVFSH